MQDERAVVRALLNTRADANASWKERRDQMDLFGAAAPLPPDWRISDVDLGRPTERHDGAKTRADAALLYFQGGGYCLGSPRSHRGLVAQVCAAADVTGFAVDYRLAPEDPFPAAVDDAVRAYRALLAMGFAPEAIILAGDSAGGGLALAAALRLKAEGAAMPAGLYLISPWLNLAQEGRSFSSKAEVDPMVSKGVLDVFAQKYLGIHDKRDVFASPLLGDLKGLPPVLVQVGADEVLFDDSEAFGQRAQAADIPYSVEIWPRMIHVFPAFYPMLTAARDAIAGAGAWMRRRLD